MRFNRRRECLGYAPYQHIRCCLVEEGKFLTFKCHRNCFSAQNKKELSENFHFPTEKILGPNGFGGRGAVYDEDFRLVNFKTEDEKQAPGVEFACPLLGDICICGGNLHLWRCLPLCARGKGDGLVSGNS